MLGTVWPRAQAGLSSERRNLNAAAAFFCCSLRTLACLKEPRPAALWTGLSHVTSLSPKTPTRGRFLFLHFTSRVLNRMRGFFVRLLQMTKGL
jgi:hypothetical protein